MSENSSEIEFNEFKNAVLNMVNHTSSHSSLVSQLNNYLKDIITTHSLKPPYQKETNNFLEIFSVKLIEKILQTNEKSKSIQKPYQSILNNYVKILSVLITSPYPKFINSAQSIITQKSHNFYKVAAQFNFGMPTDTSQYFYDNAREFAKSTLLDSVITYYKKLDELTPLSGKNNSQIPEKKANCNFDLDQTIQISSIIRPLSRFFDKTQLNEYVISVLNPYKKWLSALETETFKNIDESTLNKLNNTLFSITSNGDVKTQISIAQISFNIKLFNTMLLRLQFKALESIKTCLNKSYLHIKQMTIFLKKENFLCTVMNIKDMHHQLVPDFAIIFGYMAKNGDVTIDEILQFWLLSTSQHPSVIDYFFKPWYSLFYDFQGGIINEFFFMVANVQKFPDAALKFLKKVAYKASEQPKEVLFTTLMEMLNKNEFSKSEDLVVDLLCSLIPSNDEDFCLNLQKKCIAMISNNQQIDIALPLLKNSCKSVSVKKAREYFDAVLKSMLKGNVDVASYFDLLIKILENMNDKFNEDEFNDLKKLVCPLLDSEYFRDVCEFFTNLMNIKNKFATNEMLCEIFELISKSTYFDSGSFSFVKQLFEKINDKSKIDSKNQPIDILWNLFLNNTKCQNLCNYIISIFETSPRVFIEKCFSSITKYEDGSLILLDKFINYVEDGLSLEDLGIHSNRFCDLENYFVVYLQGDLEMEIKVYTWISYRSFLMLISRILEKDPQRIRLKVGETYLNSNNFYLQNYAHLNVSCSSHSYISYVEAVKYKNPPINVSNLPSSILLEEQYSTVLFKLLKKSKSQRILSILNKIPTIPSEYELIVNGNKSNENDDTSWKKIFNIKKSNLFLYRLNIIGNLIQMPKMDWIETFFITNGLTVFLKIVLSKNLMSYFNDSEDFSLIFKITILLMNIPDFESSLEEAISTLASKTIPQMIELLNDDSVKPKMILNILTIFKIFVSNHTEYIENNDKFNELSSKLLFSTNVSVRKEILNVIDLLSLESQKKIVSLLLPIAINEKCSEYFELLKKVAMNTDDPNSLLNDLLTILYSHYKLPDKEKYGVIQVLTFSLPKQNFSSGLLLCISILMSRMKNVPNVVDFLHFLSKNILFNSLKYFKLTSDILNILLTILKMAPETGDFILSHLKILASHYSDYKSNYNFVCSSSKMTLRPMKIELSSTARSRGLRNLGATCYMNATIQQLYNICELREKVLKIDFNLKHQNKKSSKKLKKSLKKNKYYFDYKEERDWIQEFQYLFAQLSFYPSKSIDTLPFVSKWTGWDGELINPREQQDAVEFLQMILERLDERVKGLTSMFQGQIIHTLVGRKVQYSNTLVENFLTLSLEVKNHQNIQESLKTFLVPDHFEGSNGYTVEGQGMIDADRYHKILIAPKILIIQLKRFEYNLSSNTRVKVNSEYHFPLELDLSPVMETETVTEIESENKNKNDKNLNENLYELVGVVMHMGSAVAGHYFSHVKRDNGEWLTLNDQQVRKCDGENLPITAAGGYTNNGANENGFYPQGNYENDTNAYLLFYRKINVSLAEESESQSRFHSISDLSHYDKSYNSSENETTETTSSELIKDDESSSKSVIQNNKDNEIDHDCLCHLVSDIQQAISKEIATSDVFSNLVMNLCSAGNLEDGEFLYSHMIQTLRISSVKEKENNSNENEDYSNSENNGFYKLPIKLRTSLVELFKKEPKFADFVLLQESDINEFLISNVSSQVRSFFSVLLCDALSSCNHKADNDAINHFIEFMRSKLNSSIISNFSDFNEFFAVLKKLVSVTSEESSIPFDKENWKKSILSFLTETIPDFSKKNQNQKLFNNVDLSSVFQLASMFSIDFKIIAENIIQWSFSMKHSFELIKLVSEKIDGDEEATNIFIEIVQSKDLSANQMSLFFVINLSVDDKFNKQRDEVIEKTVLKQQSFKEFLENLKLRIKDFNGKLSKRFLSFAPLFVKTFLFKSDSTSRGSLEQLVYAVFANECREDLHEFMMILIRNKKLFETAVTKSSADTLTLATVYFQLLDWIVKTADFKEEILSYSKDFFGLLKKFGKEEFVISYQRCFSFIFDVFGDNPKEFIDSVSSSGTNVISKFISSAPEGFIDKGENISKFLRFLYPLNCSQELFFTKSESFKTMCLYGFNDWKSGQDLRVFISLKMNLQIDKKNKKMLSKSGTQKDDNLIMKVCSILWEKNIFEKNISYGCISFIGLSWSILKQYPKTSNIFFDNKCYEFLWRKISFELKQLKRELRLRAKMKLFAAFTNSYMNENKDKKFIMKGSRNDLLVKRYMKDLCISTASAINACFYTNFPSSNSKTVVISSNSFEMAPNEANLYTSSRKDSASCPNLKEKRSFAGPADLGSEKSLSDDFSYYSSFISSSNSGKSGIFDFLSAMISIDPFYFSEVSKMLCNEKHGIVAYCQIDSQIAGAKFMAKMVNLMVKNNKLEDSIDLIIKEILNLSSAKEYFFESVDIISGQLQGMIPDIIKISGNKHQNKSSRTGKINDLNENMSYIYKLITAFNNFYRSVKDIRMFSQDVKKTSFMIPDSNKDINEELIKCQRLKWCENAMKMVSSEITKISKMKCDMKNDDEYHFTENQLKILESSRTAIKIGLDFVNECCSRFNLSNPKISVSQIQLKSVSSKFQSVVGNEFSKVANDLIQLGTV